MGKRILILSEKVGEGHERAAKAVQKAIYTLEFAAHVLILNPWKTFYPALTQLSTETYLMTLKVKPELWGYIYDKERAQKGKKIIKVVGKGIYFQMERVLKHFKPDFILCTHPFTYYAIYHFKKELVKNGVTIASIITDYDIHGYWIDDCVDIYFVASDDIKQKIADNGVRPDNIYVTGIPVDPSFSKRPDKYKTRIKLGLDVERPVVLIMGGGLGLGNIESIAQEISKVRRNYQVIIIAGSNEELKNKAMAIARESLTPMHVTGFVNNINEYMAASDLIVTKAGGLTISEALAMELPIIINTALPGQEMYNLDFLLKKQAAIKANGAKDIIAAIDQLLTNAELYETIKENCRKISKPNSAIDVAKIILDKIDQSKKFFNPSNK
ncbi:processive 1,2-diacylglycerol beta-glucosyltransferase [Caldanaerobius fijiensis DSM 17918]|uniref:Processive 1,2-diacylglycerol beta-glucosyltransferase n=1 Tax=Caldanaerobius fijiensis DSM 17918 TaxID=1121256 RepID=A0A1M5BF57_9THEO|nr:glycosyltransferase [Caldanaerobius fijiensis]SHF41129.1 processive 1,2-diacylglycerol beta-glucosyltransferase [Caldanaerobius fijiensis DSM 17918]